jgi:hypothetical protein
MRGWKKGRFRPHGLLWSLPLLAAIGCGPLTLDVSSIEDLERTVSQMREPMSEADSARFDEALFYLVGAPWLGKAKGASTLGEGEIALLAPLSGSTAEGIMAEARRRRMSEVRSAVSALEDLRDTSVAARRDLSAFRFSEAHVFKRNRGYLEWPVIEFRIENATNHYVSMVNFRAVLLKPGHDKPWLVEDFDLVFFDGLAPGERNRWRVEPEQREWIQLVDPHPDLEFVLEAMRLEAIGGRVLSASGWGSVEARRLQRYEHTLDEIRDSDTLALDQPPLPSLPPLALEEVAGATAGHGDGNSA